MGYHPNPIQGIQGALVVPEDLSQFLLFQSHLLGHGLQGVALRPEGPDGLQVSFTWDATRLRSADEKEGGTFQVKILGNPR